MSLERADAKHHGVRCLIPMSRPGSVLVAQGGFVRVVRATEDMCVHDDDGAWLDVLEDTLVHCLALAGKWFACGGVHGIALGSLSPLVRVGWAAVSDAIMAVGVVEAPGGEAPGVLAVTVLGDVQLWRGDGTGALRVAWRAPAPTAGVCQAAHVLVGGANALIAAGGLLGGVAVWRCGASDGAVTLRAERPGAHAGVVHGVAVRDGGGSAAAAGRRGSLGDAGADAVVVVSCGDDRAVRLWLDDGSGGLTALWAAFPHRDRVWGVSFWRGGVVSCGRDTEAVVLADTGRELCRAASHCPQGVWAAAVLEAPGREAGAAGAGGAVGAATSGRAGGAHHGRLLVTGGDDGRLQWQPLGSLSGQARGPNARVSAAAGAATSALAVGVDGGLGAVHAILSDGAWVVSDAAAGGRTVTAGSVLELCDALPAAEPIGGRGEASSSLPSGRATLLGGALGLASAAMSLPGEAAVVAGRGGAVVVLRCRAGAPAARGGAPSDAAPVCLEAVVALAAWTVGDVRAFLPSGGWGLAGGGPSGGGGADGPVCDFAVASGSAMRLFRVQLRPGGGVALSLQLQAQLQHGRGVESLVASAGATGLVAASTLTGTVQVWPAAEAAGVEPHELYTGVSARVASLPGRAADSVAPEPDPAASAGAAARGGGMATSGARELGAAGVRVLPSVVLTGAGRSRALLLTSLNDITMVGERTRTVRLLLPPPARAPGGRRADDAPASCPAPDPSCRFLAASLGAPMADAPSPACRIVVVPAGEAACAPGRGGRPLRSASAALAHIAGLPAHRHGSSWLGRVAAVRVVAEHFVSGEGTSVDAQLDAQPCEGGWSPPLGAPPLLRWALTATRDELELRDGLGFGGHGRLRARVDGADTRLAAWAVSALGGGGPTRAALVAAARSADGGSVAVAAMPAGPAWPEPDARWARHGRVAVAACGATFASGRGLVCTAGEDQLAMAWWLPVAGAPLRPAHVWRPTGGGVRVATACMVSDDVIALGFGGEDSGVAVYAWQEGQDRPVFVGSSSGEDGWDPGPRAAGGKGGRGGRGARRGRLTGAGSGRADQRTTAITSWADGRGGLVLVSATSGGRVALWRVKCMAEGGLERVVTSSGGPPVLSACRVGRGALATGHSDGTLRLWPCDGVPMLPLSGARRVSTMGCNCMAALGEGRVVVGGDDQSLSVVTVTPGGDVSAVVWVPCAAGAALRGVHAVGDTVVTLSVDQEARVWRAAEPEGVPCGLPEEPLGAVCTGVVVVSGEVPPAGGREGLPDGDAAAAAAGLAHRHRIRHAVADMGGSCVLVTPGGCATLVVAGYGTETLTLRTGAPA